MLSIDGCPAGNAFKPSAKIFVHGRRVKELERTTLRISVGVNIYQSEIIVE